MRKICIALGLLAALIASLTPARAQVGNTTGLVVSTCGSPPNAFKAGNAGPFTVDTTGTLCSQGGGGGGGGTSSSFGAAFPATGTAVGMSQGGNMVAFTGTSGNLNVQCANCSGSGASATDQAAFTAGASVFAPFGGVFNDGLANLSSGQQAMGRLTNDRQLKVLDSALLAAVQGPIAAGTAIIGKVGIDQTTPGTTNAVQATNLPSSVATNSGTTSASTLRVVVATDQPTNTNPLLTRGSQNFGAAQLSHTFQNVSSSGNNTIVTRSVGTIKVYALTVSCASGVDFTWQNGTSTAVSATQKGLQTYFMPISAEPYFTTTGTNNFVLNLGGAVACGVDVWYLDN